MDLERAALYPHSGSIPTHAAQSADRSSPGDPARCGSFRRDDRYEGLPCSHHPGPQDRWLALSEAGDFHAKTWLHADRTAGGDRDHRRPDRPAAAGRPGGPRGGPAGAVRQQPEADRPGAAQLPQRQRRLPDGLQQRRVLPSPAPTAPAEPRAPTWRCSPYLERDADLQRDQLQLGLRPERGTTAATSSTARRTRADQDVPLPVRPERGRRGPSPALSNTNSYYACVGTTTNLPRSRLGERTLLNWPTTGLFTYMRSYGIRDHRRDVEHDRVRRGGRSATSPSSAARSTSGSPTSAALRRSLLVDARTNPATAQSGIAGLHAGLEHQQRRHDRQAAGRRLGPRLHGQDRCSTPSRRPTTHHDEWTHCSTQSGSAGRRLSNADSYHPGGVNVTDGRRQRQVHQGLDQPEDLRVALGTKGNGEAAQQR